MSTSTKFLDIIIPSLESKFRTLAIGNRGKNSNEALTLYEARNYTEALQKFSYVLSHKVDPSNPTSQFYMHHYMGNCYLYMGKFVKALTEYHECEKLYIAQEQGTMPFDRGIKLDQRDIVVTKTLVGIVGLRIGDYDDANRELCSAQAVFPQDPIINFYCGMLCNGKGNHTDALTAFMQASAASIDSDSFRTKISYHIAWCQYKLRNLKEANDACDQALRLEAKDAEFYNIYARILHTRNHQDDALIQINRAIDLEPENPFYLSAKANILLSQGDVKQALPILYKARKVINKCGKPFGGLDYNDREEMEQLRSRDGDLIAPIQDMLSTGVDPRSEFLSIARSSARLLDQEALPALAVSAKISTSIIGQQEVLATSELADYYFGFRYTLSQTYSTSKIFEAREFVHKLSTGVKCGAFLVSMVPLLGTSLQTAVTTAGNFYEGMKELRYSAKFVQIAGNDSELDRIADNIGIHAIQHPQKMEWICSSDPARTAKVDTWYQRFWEKCKHLGEYIDESVYGTPYDTLAKKKGHYDACKVIKHWVEQYTPGHNSVEAIKTQMLSDYLLGNIEFKDGDTYI